MVICHSRNALELQAGEPAGKICPATMGRGHGSLRFLLAANVRVFALSL